MAQNSSTTPEQRAQLLRELSQDLNRTRSSSASTKFSQGTASPNATSSSFDPENEALISTRQFDNTAQKLPDLRASAQKYSRFSRPDPHSELDYVIDTSAIGRAFPDFTQGPSSSDDGSMSIELGRGLKKGSGATIGKLGRSNRSPTPVTSNRDDSFDFSAPMIGNHYVTDTPPLANPKTRKSNGAVQSVQASDSQVRRSSGLRNEIRETTSPVAKIKDYVSGSSRQGSESRHTLAAMHARVRDEKDTSYINEDRPPTIDLTARSSRFSSGKYQNQDQRKPLPAKFSAKHNFAQPNAQVGTNTTSKKRPGNYGQPISKNGTQSIVLPDMPNVSELVSGVFEDGTPVFSLDGKPRSTRFASKSRSQQRQSSRPDHVGVDEIDVPEDEQDIYLSLQVLQDKVSDLERIRGEAELAIGNLQERNRILESEKGEQKRRQRSDSAIGLTDGGSDAGDEMSGGQRKLLIEKNRLESSVRALTSQVESSERKVAVSDTTLRNVTKERDSAISQLGVAYFTIEQLKSDNAQLIDENHHLKAKLARTTADGNGGTENEFRKENDATIGDQCIRKQASMTGLERLTEASNGTGKRQTKQLEGTERLKLQIKDRLEAQTSGNVQPRRSTGTVPKDPARQDGSRRSHRAESHVTDLFPHTEQTQRSVQYAESESSEDSDNNQLRDTGIGSNSRQMRPKHAERMQNVTRDLTYLSFLENDEIANLRRTLEQERLERKQRQASNAQTSKNRESTVQIEAAGQPPQQTAPRKSSLKNATRRATDPVDVTEHSVEQPEAISSQKIPSENTRRHSETSVDIARRQRSANAVDNMTSAFILPDITIREPAPELSAAGEKVLDNLQNHDGGNCTVCQQKVKTGLSHDHTSTEKETVNIPKPIPVSERMPEPAVYNEDPTIRPSQPPARALACVLKGLEDELAHQKMQLAHYQKLYSGHDPALSKRQRKSVCAKIEMLVKVVDIKADQIYSLYDVLEGQKQDGHDFTENEVEVTLQSIGVDVADLGLRGGGLEDNVEQEPVERHPWDLESHDASEDEHPWEGIESTAGTTKSCQGVESRRRSRAN